jgi:hypothetical protein
MGQESKKVMLYVSLCGANAIIVNKQNKLCTVQRIWIVLLCVQRRCWPSIRWITLRSNWIFYFLSDPSVVRKEFVRYDTCQRVEEDFFHINERMTVG